MTPRTTDAGRLAQASIFAVLAAGMLPAQLFGGLLFALDLGRTPVPALIGGGLMFVLAVCNAIAVLLPMALILQSQQRLRRVGFVLVGFGLGALAMATCAWPGDDSGPLLQRLRYIDTFDVISYGLSVLAAGGFGAVAGWAFHAVFRLSLAGSVGPMPPALPGEGA
ncbi:MULTISPECIES: hypothetical protein [Stenotrophomonas]|uniref:Transmembrane protein n=1 Tax=Stenotrophomonas maltophilia TaxID=40324 RepID=A0AAD0BUH9_STEMA|nr:MULTISPECIES: hypothetical protein [Stenotrophomonas]AUI07189.1 hypothetical protein SmaCSM2_08355 [Stenotrophomonas maltophilia]EKU9977794.1 hypothetical protein [Stenotrophomonas maltophilia]KMU61301.1 hypothetical protein STRNTR1_3770 [Stenotrophomonas maltophilia]MBA2131010.1 hypothetical protein [Stenotrophomonas maltophilia]MBH1684170.1 hypothetical protein [Stenotrophomonas maltophilia]